MSAPTRPRTYVLEGSLEYQVATYVVERGKPFLVVVD
jgi:hypothetical protein